MEKEKPTKQNLNKEPHTHTQNNLLPKWKHALNRKLTCSQVHTQQTVKNSNSIKLML